MQECKLPRCSRNSSTFTVLLELDEITLYLAPVVQGAFSNNKASCFGQPSVKDLIKQRQKSDSSNNSSPGGPSGLVLALFTAQPSPYYSLYRCDISWSMGKSLRWRVLDNKQKAETLHGLSYQHPGEKKHPGCISHLLPCSDINNF